MAIIWPFAAPTVVLQDRRDANLTTAWATTAFTAAIPVGTLLVCDIGGNVISSLAATYTVVDSKGNTWQQDVAPILNATAIQETRWSTVVTAALTTSDTLTLDPDNSVGRVPVNVNAVTPPRGTAWLDQQTSAALSSSTSLSVGPTGTLAQPDEIAFAAFTLGAAPVLTWTGGFTAAGNKASTNGTTDKQIWTGYKIVTATTAVTATATLDSAVVSAAMISTYKATAVPVAARPMVVRTPPAWWR